MFAAPNFFLAGSSVTNGEAVYTTPGTYTFVVPTGITSVSAVCVGGSGGNQIWDCGGYGGNLRYKNNIAVTEGDSLTVIVGAGGAGPSGTGGNSSFVDVSVVCARGGQAVGGSQTGTDAGDGGGNGGASYTSPGGGQHHGGGGAGGYSGNGGNGDNGYYIGPAQSGSGGGGGGGGGQYNQASGRGGGVGLYGEGVNGAGGSNGGTGGAGSGGNSTNPQYVVATQQYGGGAGSDWYGQAQAGAPGAVRIVWSTALPREFPSTNVGYLL